jgi:hypothetical protein
MSGRRKAPGGEPLASRRRTLAGIAAAAPAAALASPARARESGLPAVERALWEVEAELDVLLAGLDRLEERVAESLVLVSCPQDVAVTVGYSVCASEREVRQAAARWGVAVAECQWALEELRIEQAKLTAFRERHGLAGLDQRAFDLATRAAALEDQLATTPAATTADVAVKVRRLLASALAGGDGREAALARTALEALERLGEPV